MIDEDMVDVSPYPHGNQGLVILPLSYAINDESFEDDRFEDNFATEDDFHAYDELWFSHDDHDISSDYWKFIGNPIYDFFNEGNVNFEVLDGKTIFGKDPYGLVYTRLFTIDDDIGLHVEDSITNIGQPCLPSPSLGLNHHFQPLFSRIYASFGQQVDEEPLVEQPKHVRRHNEEYQRG